MSCSDFFFLNLQSVVKGNQQGANGSLSSPLIPSTVSGFHHSLSLRCQVPWWPLGHWQMRHKCLVHRGQQACATPAAPCGAGSAGCTAAMTLQASTSPYLGLQKGSSNCTNQATVKRKGDKTSPHNAWPRESIQGIRSLL